MTNEQKIHDLENENTLLTINLKATMALYLDLKDKHGCLIKAGNEMIKEEYYHEQCDIFEKVLKEK